MPARTSLQETRITIDGLAHDLIAARGTGFSAAAEMHLDEAHEALLRAGRHLGHAVRCDLETRRAAS